MTKNLENPKRKPGKSGRVTITAEEIPETANNEVLIFNPHIVAQDSGLAFFILYRNI